MIEIIQNLDIKTKKITSAEALLKLTLIGMRVTATITNQIADP